MDVHLEEMDDHKKFSESVKAVSQLEYVSCLHELKHEITQAWYNNDRVTSLKLSIKVRFLIHHLSFYLFLSITEE